MFGLCFSVFDQQAADVLRNSSLQKRMNKMEDGYKKRCQTLENTIADQQVQMEKQNKEIANLMVYKNGYDEIQRSERNFASY